MKKLRFILLYAIVSFIASAGNPAECRPVTEEEFPKNTMALERLSRRDVSREYVFENLIQDRFELYSDYTLEHCSYAVSDTLHYNGSEYMILFEDIYGSNRAYLCYLNGKKYPKMLRIYAAPDENYATFSVYGDEIEICTADSGMEHPYILQQFYRLNADFDLIDSNINISEKSGLEGTEDTIVLHGKVNFEDFPVLETLPDSTILAFPEIENMATMPDSIVFPFSVEPTQIFFEDARKNLIQLQNSMMPSYWLTPPVNNLYFGLGRYIINGNTYFVLLNITGQYEQELYLATMPESQNYPELLMIWSNDTHSVNYQIIEDRMIEVSLEPYKIYENRRVMRFNLDSHLSRIE